MKLKACLLLLDTLELICDFSLEEKNTDITGAHSVVSIPIITGGKLAACRLDLTAVLEDRAHIHQR